MRSAKKRLKAEQTQTYDLSEYVSATSTKAYMLKDPILDWFKYNKTKKITESECNDTVSTFMMSKGIEFERHITLLLKNVFDGDYVDIDGCSNPRSPEKHQETLDALSKGVPLIFSGLLWNHTNRTYGVPDIIIRSDYLKELVHYQHLSPKQEKIGSVFSNRFHYVIVDIKFMTLPLSSGGHFILNKDMIPCYKAQLYVYNQALSVVQGYTPPCAYLLGRRWHYKTKGIEFNGDSCFDRLGVINYATYDAQYCQQTEKAIEWVKNVRVNCSNLDPNSDSNIFPNMCNKYDFPYHEAKLDYAKRNEEITDVWMCGVKHRVYAVKDGIMKWSDPRCTSATLGIRGPKISPLVDSILETNRNNSVIRPERILSGMGEWRRVRNTELYVDFETINDAFLTDFTYLPISKKLNMVFAIGVLIVTSEKIEYKVFCVNDFILEEEKRICKSFARFVKECGVNTLLIHWSKAEPNMWSNVVNKHQIDIGEVEWFDVLELFKTEPITVKGAFNFSLKTIARAFYNNSFISCVWDTKTTDGGSVMLNATKAIEEARLKDEPLCETLIMKDIIRYNQIDCKTVYEILKHLRDHH